MLPSALRIKQMTEGVRVCTRTEHKHEETMNDHIQQVENDIVEVSVTEVMAAEGELAGICTSATVCIEATSRFISTL